MPRGDVPMFRVKLLGCPVWVLGWWLVIGAVAEYCEDGVAVGVGQADHGCVVVVAFGLFAVVVGLGGSGRSGKRPRPGRTGRSSSVCCPLGQVVEATSRPFVCFAAESPRARLRCRTR